MNKAHLTILALLVAGATVLGAVAVTRTTAPRRGAARHTNDAAVAAQTKQLAAYAAKLQKELQGKAAGSTPRSRRRPRRRRRSRCARCAGGAPIVYHRPPPVVTVIHRTTTVTTAPTAEERGGGDD